MKCLTDSFEEFYVDIFLFENIIATWFWTVYGVCEPNIWATLAVEFVLDDFANVKIIHCINNVLPDESRFQIIAQKKRGILIIARSTLWGLRTTRTCKNGQRILTP